MQRGQLVEVAGLEAEGFPGSWVAAELLDSVEGGATVKYAEVREVCCPCIPWRLLPWRLDRGTSLLQIMPDRGTAFEMAH